VIKQERLGLVAALNRSLAEASGAFIARMDADDLAHPRRLELQVAHLSQHPQVQVVGCLVRSFPRAVLTEGMLRYEHWLNSLLTHEQMMRDLYVESPLAHPSVMMRSDGLRQAGGYQAAGWAEDYDLWHRLALLGARFGKVQHYLHWWHERDDRLSRVDRAYAPGAFRACKVHYLKVSHLAGRESVVIWGAGKEGKALARHLRRNGIAISQWIDIDPNKIGRKVLGAPVLPPEALTQDEYLLVAVGAHGARELIRTFLREHSWREPDHYRTLA